jgi:hypothetical protein
MRTLKNPGAPSILSEDYTSLSLLAMATTTIRPLDMCQKGLEYLIIINVDLEDFNAFSKVKEFYEHICKR